MRSRSRKPLIPAIVALLALGVWAEIRYTNPSPKKTNDPAVADQPHQIAIAPPPTSGSRTTEPRNPAQSSVSIANSPRAVARPPTPAVTPFAAPDEAALAEIDQVGLMLRDYRTIAGENPVGTNAEIMAAVMGGNEKHATLGPPEGMKLNEKGELVDRWGTPYFFHQLSRDHMEIHSAGPDRIMWTEDDPVIR